MRLRSAEGMKFFAGEILITTVGILIALAANALWQNHQDRISEVSSLRSLELMRLRGWLGLRGGATRVSPLHFHDAAPARLASDVARS